MYHTSKVQENLITQLNKSFSLNRNKQFGSLPQTSWLFSNVGVVLWTSKHDAVQTGKAAPQLLLRYVHHNLSVRKLKLAFHGCSSVEVYIYASDWFDIAVVFMVRISKLCFQEYSVVGPAVVPIWHSLPVCHGHILRSSNSSIRPAWLVTFRNLTPF